MAITYFIIGFTVIISLYALNNAEVMSKMILNPYVVSRRQEYYRFLTSGFLHADHMHLFVNMLTLYFFGPLIEKDLGKAAFVILYVVAIVVSDIPTFVKHKNNPGYNSLGASGGVAAIIFAAIILHPLAEFRFYFFIPITAFIFGALYIIYSYWAGRNSRDNINHDAHLWGALCGIAFCAIFYPSSIPECLDQIIHWRPAFLQ